MNKELNVYQEEWFRTIFEPYVNAHPDACISSPFFTGICDKYIASKKRIMIVGQQTNGWKIYKHDSCLQDSQQWTIDYLNRQLDYESNGEFKKNNSPFWSFFKDFSHENIIPCWNNIDKAQRNIKGESQPLTEEIEIALNHVLPLSKKTLFQREVEITKPNAVVFITGPSYQKTMETAMELNNNALTNFLPRVKQPCIDITDPAHLGIPAFWTYHPNYIKLSNTISWDTIITTIKKSLTK